MSISRYQMPDYIPGYGRVFPAPTPNPVVVADTNRKKPLAIAIQEEEMAFQQFLDEAIRQQTKAPIMVKKEPPAPTDKDDYYFHMDELESVLFPKEKP